MTLAEQFQATRNRVAGLRAEIAEAESALRRVEAEASQSASVSAAALIARQQRAADQVLGRFHEKPADVAVLDARPPVDAEAGLRTRLKALRVQLADAELALKGIQRRALESIVATAKADYAARASELFLAYEDLRELEAMLSTTSHFAILGGGAHRFYVPGLSDRASFNGTLPGCDLTELKQWTAHARIQQRLKEALGE